LTGCELCHAVWTAAFDAFKSNSIDEGALLVVSLGPRSSPLAALEVPPNAICLPFIAQQAVLKEGVDLFLSHGGQNSFTEAMMYATPVVVCPGFGDQIVNSCKAESLGVGIKVDRPRGKPDASGDVGLQYRRDVCQALLEVYAKKQLFKVAAQACKERLQSSGGLLVALSTFTSVAEAGLQSSSTKLSEQASAQVLTHVTKAGGA